MNDSPPAIRWLRSLRNLPLLWKLLTPFLVLIIIVGAAGASLIVRNLASRAQSTLNRDLLQASLQARSTIQGRELYLLESANFAANLAGIADAVRAGDSRAAANLLRSVQVLKEDLNLIVLAGNGGVGIVEIVQLPGKETQVGSGTSWKGLPFAAEALAGGGGDRVAGFHSIGEESMLSIAAPICSAVEGCSSVGVALVGMSVSTLVSEAVGEPEGEGVSDIGITVLDSQGETVATSGEIAHARENIDLDGELLRVTEEVGEFELATLYAPLDLQGRQQGVVAVTLPTEPIFGSVRGAGLRLALILLAAIGGIVTIAALLSRYMLGQVHLLLEANRALGRGELSARAPVINEDEIGELARGLNQMAEQLQASYETLEMRVDQRTEEIQRLLGERTQFFASLSHELRTPIAVIIGQAEMLLDPDYAGRRKLKSEVGLTLKNSGEQLLALVNEILELARLEAGRFEVDLTEVGLEAVISQVLPTIRGLASQAGLDLALEIPTELPRVTADPLRMREVILNLVDNAVKYTPRGGWVEIAASEVNGSVELSVSDNGAGIPEEIGERVFEPFFVVGTGTQRGEPSSGLGLALTKGIVEAQGGEIDFESTFGKGTVFKVRLPATQESPRANPAGNRALQGVTT